MFIGVKHVGNFNATTAFLKKLKEMQIESILGKYGEMGVEALAEATPKRTGLTAASWTYEIEKNGQGYSLHWLNINVQRGENIALLLQTGHGTGWHTYVRGRDYINPALQPIFDEISQSIWSEVVSL